jgi:hypothetical protein
MAILNFFTFLQQVLDKNSDIFKGIPLQCTIPAGLAYIHFLKGNTELALQNLAAGLKLALQSPLALCFQPNVYMLRDLISKARSAITDMQMSSTVSSFATVDLRLLEADMQQFMQLTTLKSGVSNAGRGELLNLSSVFWPQNVSDPESASGAEFEESMRRFRHLESMGDVPSGSVKFYIEHFGFKPDIGTGSHRLPLLYVPPDASDVEVPPSTSTVMSTYLNSSVGRFMAWDDPASENEQGVKFDLNDFDADSVLDAVDFNSRSSGQNLGQSSTFIPTSSSSNSSSIVMGRGDRESSLLSLAEASLVSSKLPSLAVLFAPSEQSAVGDIASKTWMSLSPTRLTNEVKTF